MRLTGVSIVLLTGLFLAASSPSAPATAARPRPPLQACNGCAGNAASTSMSTGVGTGFLSLMSTTTSGRCKWLLDLEDWSFSCTQYTACPRTTLAVWTGLQPGSELGLCLQEIDEVVRCQVPSLIVGPEGSGLSEEGGTEDCEDEPSGSSVYLVTSESGGLSASVSSMCTKCGS